MFRLKKSITVILAVLLVFFHMPVDVLITARAENTLVFTGSVLNPVGKGLPGVSVKVCRSGSEDVLRTIQTDDSGAWKLDGMAYQVIYDVQFSKNGYSIQPNEMEICENNPSVSESVCEDAVATEAVRNPAEIVTPSPSQSPDGQDEIDTPAPTAANAGAESALAEPTPATASTPAGGAENAGEASVTPAPETNPNATAGPANVSEAGQGAAPDGDPAADEALQTDSGDSDPDLFAATECPLPVSECDGSLNIESPSTQAPVSDENENGNQPSPTEKDGNADVPATSEAPGGPARESSITQLNEQDENDVSSSFLGTASPDDRTSSQNAAAPASQEDSLPQEYASSEYCTPADSQEEIPAAEASVDTAATSGTSSLAQEASAAAESPTSLEVSPAPNSSLGQLSAQKDSGFSGEEQAPAIDAPEPERISTGAEWEEAVRALSQSLNAADDETVLAAKDTIRFLADARDLLQAADAALNEDALTAFHEIEDRLNRLSPSGSAASEKQDSTESLTADEAVAVQAAGSIAVAIDPVFAQAGDIVTLTATVTGYEGASFQWQWASIPENNVESILNETANGRDAPDGMVVHAPEAGALTWHDEAGATETVYRFVGSAENLNRYWRIVATVSQNTETGGARDPEIQETTCEAPGGDEVSQVDAGGDPAAGDGLQEQNAGQPGVEGSASLFSFLGSLLIGKAEAEEDTTIVSEGYASLLGTAAVPASSAASPACEITLDKTSVAIGGHITANYKITGGTPPYNYLYLWYVYDGEDAETFSGVGLDSQSVLAPQFGDSGTFSVFGSDADGVSFYAASERFTITGAETEPLSVDVALDQTTLNVGEVVTARWSVSGGQGPYEYASYWHQVGGAASHSYCFSNSQVTSFSPASGGEWAFQLQVYDALGRSYISGDYPFNVTGTALEPAADDRLACSVSAEITEENTVIATCTAGGGTPPYTYSYFWWYYTNTGVSTLYCTSDTSSTTDVFSPGQAVRGHVWAYITDADNNTADSDEADFVLPGASSRAPLDCEISLSSETVSAGGTVTADYAVSGGLPPYSIADTQLNITESDGSVTEIGGIYHEEATETGSVSRTISFGKEGYFQFEVQDASGLTSTFYSPYFTILNAAPATALRCDVNLDKTVCAVGDTVTAQWSASGGTVPYTYRYSWVFTEGDDLYISGADEPTDDTQASRRVDAGEYGYFTLEVTDTLGREGYFASGEFVVTGSVPGIALGCEITLDRSTVGIGEAVTVSCEAYGGTAPYKYGYAWEIYDESGRETRTLVPDSESPTAAYTPTAGISGIVSVSVTDGIGRSYSGSVSFTITGTESSVPVGLSPSGLSVGADGNAAGPSRIAVTATGGWRAVCNASWLHVALPPYAASGSLDGSGNATVYITADGNPSTAGRSSTVTFTNGAGMESRLAVQQAGQTVKDDIYLTLDGLRMKNYLASADNVYYFDSSAKSLRVNVVSTGAWAVKTACNYSEDGVWIACPASGSGSAGITIDIEACPAGVVGYRTGAIQFSTGSASFEIMLKQSGAESKASSSVNSLSFYYDDHDVSKSFALTANNDWAIDVSGGDTSWLTLSQTSGSPVTNRKIQVTATERNLSYQERKASLNIRCQGVILKTVIVTQKGLDQKTYLFDEEYRDITNGSVALQAGRQNVWVLCPYEWKISCGDERISLSAASGKAGKLTSVTVSSNESVFSDANKEATLTVYQKKLILWTKSAELKLVLTNHLYVWDGDGVLIGGGYEALNGNVLDINREDGSGEKTVTVFSYGDWVAKTDGGGCSLSAASGKGGQKTPLSITLNGDAVSGDETLTIVSGSEKVTLILRISVPAEDQKPFEAFDFTITLGTDMEIASGGQSSVAWSGLPSAKFCEVCVYNFISHKQVTDIIAGADEKYVTVGALKDGIYYIVAFAMDENMQRMAYPSGQLPEDRLSTDTEIRSNMLMIYSGTQAWAWPAPGVKKLISGYTAGKSQLEAMRSTEDNTHLAIDINDDAINEEKVEEPVVAARDGVIVGYTATGTNQGTACVIVMKHEVPNGNGGTTALYTRYVHLKSGSLGLYGYDGNHKWGIITSIKDLKAGNVLVKRGQQIAIFGNTGNSSGTHLHFCITDNQNKTESPTINVMPLNAAIGVFKGSGWEPWALHWGDVSLPGIMYRMVSVLGK